MDYIEMKKDLESGLVVPVPIELLQPIQIGLCTEKLEGLKRQKDRQPLHLWPIENGRYAVMSHTHTGFERYEQGEKYALSMLTLPIDEPYIRSLGVELTDKDRAEYQNLLKNKVQELPFRVEFVRSKGIYHLSDLVKNIFDSAGDLKFVNEKLFKEYMR